MLEDAGAAMTGTRIETRLNLLIPILESHDYSEQNPSTVWIQCVAMLVLKTLQRLPNRTEQSDASVPPIVLAEVVLARVPSAPVHDSVSHPPRR